VTHLVEDILQASLGQGTALYVFHRAELPRQSLPLVRRDWPLLLTGKLIEVSLVFTKVDLRSLHVSYIADIERATHDNEAGDSGAVVVHLGEPLLLDVLE